MTRRHNLLTDVPGLKVGNAEDKRAFTGVTVVLPEASCTAAIDIRGGGPAGRDTGALSLAGTVDQIHAIVLSGGSGFGLAAATGVQSWLARRSIGFEIGAARVPIVPQAVLFDLLNGGDKTSVENPRYEALGQQACESAGGLFTLGSAGAGFGATTATLRGGLGSASEVMVDGLVVGALVAVNAVGTVTLGNTPHFWAAPYEQKAEFGGRGLPSPMPADALTPQLKGGQAENTTLAVVATNARLDKRAAHRLAVMAQTGLARAIYPVHTPLDGDTVFAISTGEIALSDPVVDLARLGAVAGNVLARAVARGIYEAAAAPSGWTGPPAYASRFGLRQSAERQT